MQSNWSCVENRLKWEYQQEGHTCAGRNGVEKYASGLGGGWRDDWNNKDYLAECDNVDAYRGLVALGPDADTRTYLYADAYPRPNPYAHSYTGLNADTDAGANSHAKADTCKRVNWSYGYH